MDQSGPSEKAERKRLLPSERRRHGRLSCEIALSGRVGSRRGPVKALDLSVSGARVVLPNEFSESREIVLSTEGAQTSGTVRAQVVWVQRGEAGEVVAGLHFLEDPTQLETSWAHKHLRSQGGARRRRLHQARACERPVRLHCPGRKSEQMGQLVRLSVGGCMVDLNSYLHLGSRLSLDIPYGDGFKQLRIPAQVVHQQKKGRDWRMSLQFLLADEAREHVVLQQILAESKEQGDAAVSDPFLWI